MSAAYDTVNHDCGDNSLQAVELSGHSDLQIVVVVVDLPLLRVAVEGFDNPIIQSSPARRPLHMASRGTTLSGDIQRSSMLLEVYKCVQLNRWFVVCGCVLQRGEG